MRVKISFTVEADYDQWAEDMANLPGIKTTPLTKAYFRDNLKALAEESFVYAMEDYCKIEFMD